MMVLLTGGAGYIGSHVAVELLAVGHDLLIVDNLSNSSISAIKRIQEISGRNVIFHHLDLRDGVALTRVLKSIPINAVIHLAGLKSVSESNEEPLRYADHNLNGLLQLLIAMRAADVKRLIFSSSATVYGVPISLPIRENHPLAPTNVYGHTKLMSEQLLTRLLHHHGGMQIAILRYFNPVGAHESGLIGEDPIGRPNNLMPFIAQVAVGRRPELIIWGQQYDTVDGTAVRDYVHVVDLALGHARALEVLDKQGSFIANLGTGRGHSVLEVVRAFEAVSGRKIAYAFGPPRSGDVATYYADPSYAQELLRWSAERDLLMMCKDHWRWQSTNPDGYASQKSS